MKNTEAFKQMAESVDQEEQKEMELKEMEDMEDHEQANKELSTEELDKMASDISRNSLLRKPAVRRLSGFF